MNKLEQKILKYSKDQYKEFCETESLKTLHSLKIYLDDKYYNTDESEISDSQYDTLKSILEVRDPGYVPPVGVKIRENENRVKLPYFMGSADKVSSIPEEARKMDRWLDRNDSKDCVLTSKLDGMSCLYVSRNGKIKLYTRGKGDEGGDISYMSQYLSSMPKGLDVDIVVRGELVMSKSVFEGKYKDKKINGRVYKNVRNMVAGIMGGKTIRNGLKDVEFVCYEIITNEKYQKPQTKQIKILKSFGFEVPLNKVVDKREITIKNLEKYHEDFKKVSKYELDGIIVHSGNKYVRNDDRLPKYMFAFKMDDENNMKETVVKKMVWQVSKWGILKPVVIFDPVDIQGITMKKATAIHAKYVIENNIGVGARIIVTRSKEVIPKIIEVIEGVEAELPTDLEYEWDETKTNIRVTEFNVTSRIKLISNFFLKMGIKFISDATVEKLYKEGFDTLLKIIKITKKDLLTVPTIKDKSAERIIQNIKKGLTNVQLPVVLGASGCFGDSVGRKRVISLFEGIPNILELYGKESSKELIKRISDIDGFSDIIAKKVIGNLPTAVTFERELRPYVTYKNEEEKKSNKFDGMKFVMTGFRDKQLEEDIVSQGGKMSTSVSKNTSVLIVESLEGNATGKRAKAEKCGIEICERKEFIEKYML